MLTQIKPLISIIVLNWNGTELTCAFLNSLSATNTYTNIEVIIVDNHSTLDPSAKFKEVYPEVIVIRNTNNLGFSGGNNVGMRAAKGQYLFIVNNDTELTTGLLEGLLEIFEQFKDAGMACPKFHYFFNKGTIEYAGYHAVNIFTGRNGMVGQLEKDHGQYDTIRQTNYGHGGAMMVPKKIINEVGLLPEEFFLYYEELDWSERIKKKGYKIYYQPKSLIYHKESMTTGKSSPLKTFYLTRNRILFMRRNIALPGFLIFSLYFICFTIPKNTLLFYLTKQKPHLRSFWKAIGWHFNPKISL
ncbi:MAG: glycosyltransferase family 2 protein [Flavisolibacter sp.]